MVQGREVSAPAAAEERGAASRWGPPATSPARNTMRGRMGGVAGFAGAPIVAAIRTMATACTLTLTHRPAVERLCGCVLDRASANRIDMARTEPTCRSVLLQRRCCLGVLPASEVPRRRLLNLERQWTYDLGPRSPSFVIARAEPPRMFRAKTSRSTGGPVVALAALAPARASPCRILLCPSHVVSSASESARLPPARRSPRCCPPAPGRRQPARAAWALRWAPCLGAWQVPRSR